MKRPSSVKIDQPFAMRAADILSTLNYLNFLIGEEADNPGKVRQYTVMTQERLQALAKLLGPLLWLPKPAAA